MPIRLPGAGSGLSGVVDQIIAAEREPISRMEQRKQKIEAKLTLVGDFESRINKIKESLKEIIGGKNFKDYDVNVSDPNVLSGTVDPEKAVPGNWNIEVIQLADSSGVISNSAPDRNETKFGVGYLKFDTPDGEKEVYINDGNNTLEGIARAINGAGVGVNAMVVEDAIDADDPYKLILASDYYGANNDISFPTIYLLDGEQDLFFDQERDSKNGIVKVNGFDVQTSKNKLDDLIPGVSLDLKSARPGKTVNVQLTENFEAIEGKLGSFVSSVNGVLGFIQQQNNMNANTDTSRTLGGDSMLRSMEARIRRLVQAPGYGIKGNIKRLSQLGVEFNRSGTLEFKKEKFTEAVKKDSGGVLEFFRGDGSLNAGFIGKVKTMTDSALSMRTGVVSNRKRGFRTEIDRIDQSIDSKEDRLAQKEVQLRRKFSRMEEQMSKMRAQGAQLGAMGGGGGLAGLLG